MSRPRQAETDFRVVVPAGFIFSFPARIERWIDGDTPVVSVRRFAGREETGIEIRLDGINAIEIRAAYGREAKAYAEALAPPGTGIVLVERNRKEKYGRELARIILADGRDLSNELLAAKASDGVTPLATPYNP